jgi:glycosyltransferase involved in cell wall biosynthesis
LGIDGVRAFARRRLRVLVTRFAAIGGGQVWAHEFSNHLADLGHDVQVIFLRSWWPRMRARVKLEVDSHAEARYRHAVLDAPLFLESFWLARFLRRYRRQSPVDVVVSTGAEAAWLDKVRIHGAPPRVASFHHTYPDWKGLPGLLAGTIHLTRRGIAETYSRWCEYLDRISMTHADRVVCSSRDQADRVVNKLEIPEQKVRVIYYGIDSNRLFPEIGKRERLNPNVLYAGGLSLSKGLHVLLDAFARIRPRFPDARLSVVGDGHWAPYQQKVEALGLSQCVRYWGYIPHLEIGKHYRSACLLAAPTRHESFGLILAEAMACGIPVVATRVTAIPEVVEDGVTGLLVPVDDPTALADALAAVLSDPERAAAMGRAGRARVEERFAWDEIIRQWERLLFQVAEGETL